MKLKIKELDKTPDTRDIDGNLLPQFANLLPGTIHETVASPEAFKTETTWFWVMGANGDPVRVMEHEFDIVEE